MEEELRPPEPGRVVLVEIIRTVSLQDQYLADIKKTLMLPPRSIPTCYLYLDEGAELFARVCSDAAYTVYAEESRMINELAGRFPLGCLTHANIIEMGGGDPRKATPLLSALFCEANPTYTCIDLSEPMIQASLLWISQQFPQVTLRGIVADFVDGVRTLDNPDPVPRAFLFLGNTLSNFSPEDLRSLMGAVRLTMRPSDVLALGVVAGSIPKEDNIYNQSGEFQQFIEHALHTLSVNAGAEIAPGAFSVEVVNRSDIRAYCSQLVSRYRQRIALSRLDSEILLKQNERITVGISYLRTEEEIEELFSSNGFEVVEYVSSGQFGSRVFILRRTESETC
jgi:L-histidine Nalpha-methyltransferase